MKVPNFSDVINMQNSISQKLLKQLLPNFTLHWIGPQGNICHLDWNTGTSGFWQVRNKPLFIKLVNRSTFFLTNLNQYTSVMFNNYVWPQTAKHFAKHWKLSELLKFEISEILTLKWPVTLKSRSRSSICQLCNEAM